MSREVRRVPLDWKHPTEPNPYWVEQSRPFMGRPHVPSKLRGPTERFVGLMDDDELDDILAGTSPRPIVAALTGGGDE